MQEAFVGFLLQDPEENASEAARKAGASPKTCASVASKWLKLAKVADRIATLKAERAKLCHVDLEYVLTAAKDVLERCLQRTPVMEFDRENRRMVQAQTEVPCECDDPNCKGKMIVGLWEFDSQGANGALKLLASHVRGFEAPKETRLTGAGGAPLTPPVPMVNLAALSDNALKKLEKLLTKEA
jgi:hypothetical protein